MCFDLYCKQYVNIGSTSWAPYVREDWVFKSRLVRGFARRLDVSYLSITEGFSLKDGSSKKLRPCLLAVVLGMLVCFGEQVT